MVTSTKLTRKEKGTTDAPKCRVGMPWLLVTFCMAVAIFAFALARNSVRKAQNVRFLREVMLMQETLAQFVEQSTDEIPIRARLQSERVERIAGETALAGQWHLRHTNTGSQGLVTEIVIDNPDRTIREMEALDAILDDGDLASGNFVLRGPDSYAIKLLGEDNVRGRAEIAEVDTIADDVGGEDVGMGDAVPMTEE